jgi:hypothetical protein
VPFKVREPAFAGFISICSRAASFDPQIRDQTFQPHTIGFRHRSNLFRVISGALEFIQSSFSAQVPCILVCELCARLPTCGFLALSAALEPLSGSSPLDSSRQFTYPSRFIALARKAGPADTSFNALLHADSDFNIPDSDAEVVAALAAYYSRRISLARGQNS